jgi:dTDP-4-dehydrorhamnose reductase
MRILITGVEGQLGRALSHVLAEHDLHGVDLPAVDITTREAVFEIVGALAPDVVIHCAAYTNVDGCAQNPALAYRVNGLGVQNVALACMQFGADMVHLSTNEVFAGDQADGYEEWMAMRPPNPYGRSKAAAEFHIRSLLQRYYIVRTAWLYAPEGHNFIHAVLKMAREQGRLQVVTDEVGNPTSAADLAQAIGQLIRTGQYGTYHLVNEGACSRYAFAAEVLRLAGLGHIPIKPILSRDYQRVSTPPPYGALRNIAGAAIGIRLRPWREALADYVARHTTLTNEGDPAGQHTQVTP